MSRLRTSLKIVGAEQLIRDLHEVGGRRLAVNAQRRAITAAIAPIRTAARANVPVRYGWLKKSIASKVKTYQKSGSVVGVVGPRSDVQATVKDRFGRTHNVRPALYAHLVEFGTKAHTMKLGKVEVQHPGTRGSGFLRRAWEANADRAADVIETILTEAIFRGR